MAINVLGIPRDTVQAIGTKIMVHDLTQPINNNTRLTDVANIINIPQPILRYYGGDNLMVYSAGYSTEWLNYQPMMFLFRHKGSRNKRDGKAAWVHPVDINGPVRWAGFGVYNGDRRDSVGNQMAGIITEVELPNTYNGRDGFKFPFNRFMFWRSVNGIDVNPAGLQNGNTWHDFNCDFNTESQGRIIGQSNKKYSREDRKLSRKKKVQKFRIAFGIRNPNVDSTTGQSPMIFGPMSDLILTMPGVRTGAEGKGLYKGVNELGRLAFINNLQGAFQEDVNLYSKSFYEQNGGPNDIIVRIGASNTY